jgi:tRNA pseudouridine55 synthase
MDGMIVINKPKDLIAMDVSRAIKRKFGKLKMGHVGTLDPLATGVFPLLFGRATRLHDSLLDQPKSYTFSVQLGMLTDTLDVTGEVIETQEVTFTDTMDWNEICLTFLGKIRQTPPLFSAVKYKGKPLYEYARKGQQDMVPLDELSREVTIYDLKMHGWDDLTKQLRFHVTCSKGTYVRVLALELAKSIGQIGCVASIERTQSSGFDISQSVELDDVLAEKSLLKFLIPYEKLEAKE